MCGRYVSSRDPLDLAALLGVAEVAAVTPPDYNVAPTKPVPLVLARRDPAGAARVLTVGGWGLLGPAGPGRPVFNVRAETVRDKPGFARALAAARCLLPADGYYEWHQRQPYYLNPADGSPFAFAGLYVRDPATGGISCAVLTTGATPPHDWLHHRSPLVVPPPHWDAWLDPDDPHAGPELCRAATELALQCVPVSPRVNRVDNNDPGLLAAAPAMPAQSPLW